VSLRSEHTQPAHEVQQPHGFDFVFVSELPLEDRHFNDAHLFAGSASELLINARSAYLKAVAWPRLGPEFWLIIRHLAIDYVTEAFAGERLWCGVRAVSRSAKTAHLELCVWEGDSRRVVLQGAIADVAFDVRARVAVEIPDDLWLAIERYEGRALPFHQAPED